MVAKSYVPDRGDIVWLDLNPTKGREQAKRRPAIVLSPKSYNKKTSLLLACPITSVTKGYPFEVPVAHKKVEGVILADHVRSLDWRARKAERITQASSDTVEKVSTLLQLLTGETTHN